MIDRERLFVPTLTVHDSPVRAQGDGKPTQNGERPRVLPIEHILRYYRSVLTPMRALQAQVEGRAAA